MLLWLNPFNESVDDEPILKDVFDWESNGIFSAIYSVAASKSLEVPWDSDDAVILDMDYFANRSGAKFCSPLVKTMLAVESYTTDGKLNTVATQKLATIILKKYYPNISALWRATSVDYNPIHNYDMVENRTLRKAESEASVESDTTTHTGTDTLAHGLVETVNPGMTTDQLDYTYGINTDPDSPKPSGKTYTEEGGESVTTNSGSDVTTKNLQDSSSTATNKAGAGEEEEEIHRSGNIGVTTTQQMLTSERELWKWDYYEQVYEILDKELALAVCDPCRV